MLIYCPFEAQKKKMFTAYEIINKYALAFSLLLALCGKANVRNVFTAFYTAINCETNMKSVDNQIVAFCAVVATS